jgi:uncharacterized caspase-like protein
MIDRRHVVLGGLAGLIAPAIARAQGPGGPGPGGGAGGGQQGPAGGNPMAPQGNDRRGDANPNQQQPIHATVPQPARIQSLILSQSYQDTPQFALANTTRDAELIARTFQRLRFDQVTTQSDGTAQEVMARLVSYLGTVDTDTIALVYLAGHGMEVGGENLLMLNGGRVFLSLQALVQALQARAGVAILFLDACRNNPFQSFATSGAQVTRAISLGEGGDVRLQTVSLEDLRTQYSETLGRLRAFSVQGSGIKIVFSTDPANVAYDGARPNSRNSPFAQALAHRIRDQVSLDDIVSMTTGDVIRATRGAQAPWSQGSIDRPIFLSGHRRREQGSFR